MRKESVPPPSSLQSPHTVVPAGEATSGCLVWMQEYHIVARPYSAAGRKGIPLFLMRKGRPKDRLCEGQRYSLFSCDLGAQGFAPALQVQSQECHNSPGQRGHSGARRYSRRRAELRGGVRPFALGLSRGDELTALRWRRTWTSCPAGRVCRRRSDRPCRWHSRRSAQHTPTPSRWYCHPRPWRRSHPSAAVPPRR
jgi:hypothetical protein